MTKQLAKTKDEAKTTYMATESEQFYALKRAWSTLDGHVKDKFTNPTLCQAIFEGAELLKKFIMKYNKEIKE